MKTIDAVLLAKFVDVAVIMGVTPDEVAEMVEDAIVEERERRSGLKHMSARDIAAWLNGTGGGPSEFRKGA